MASSIIQKSLESNAMTVLPMDNPNNLGDFEGYYVVIGKVCFFYIGGTKNVSSWTFGVIPNVTPKVIDAVVGYDSSNNVNLAVSLYGSGNTNVQMRKSNATNKTSMYGSFIIA